MIGSAGAARCSSDGSRFGPRSPLLLAHLLGVLVGLTLMAWPFSAAAASSLHAIAGTEMQRLCESSGGCHLYDSSNAVRFDSSWHPLEGVFGVLLPTESATAHLYLLDPNAADSPTGVNLGSQYSWAASFPDCPAPLPTSCTDTVLAYVQQHVSLAPYERHMEIAPIRPSPTATPAPTPAPTPSPRRVPQSSPPALDPGDPLAFEAACILGEKISGAVTSAAQSAPSAAAVLLTMLLSGLPLALVAAWKLVYGSIETFCNERVFDLGVPSDTVESVVAVSYFFVSAALAVLFSPFMYLYLIARTLVALFEGSAVVVSSFETHLTFRLRCLRARLRAPTYIAPPPPDASVEELKDYVKGRHVRIQSESAYLIDILKKKLEEFLK